MTQTHLLCGCGGEVDCARCRRRARLNREHFSGLRELVLRRDNSQCQACGEIDITLILVHHRRPGRSTGQRLITLCRRCHVRIHFTYRPRFGFASAPILYLLWRELHRRQPEQFLLTRGEPAKQDVFGF